MSIKSVATQTTYQINLDQLKDILVEELDSPVDKNKVKIEFVMGSSGDRLATRSTVIGVKIIVNS